MIQISRRLPSPYQLAAAETSEVSVGSVAVLHGMVFAPCPRLALLIVTWLFLILL